MYAALLAAILLKRAQLSLEAGQSAEAEAFSRELLTLCARAHTDNYIDRAVELINAQSHA